MKRGKPLKRKTPLKRGESPRSHVELRRQKKLKARNPGRRAKEWARAYGSLERVLKMRRRPCCVPGCTSSAPVVNAHLPGGGMGRKGDACSVVPLCQHPHHHALDMKLGSIELFDRTYNTDLRATAARLAEEDGV